MAFDGMATIVSCDSIKEAMPVWYIYKNNRGQYSVAQQPSGDFIFQVAGPMTWADAAAWMRANHQPGW